ncbi:hypothetical protein CkaCkLH20_04729 [Colletotrichum karsti]|uniref:Uncharacterized protein n=1 Tax=Colletotrichum karsti TaxID=1095194 RepID=A0A9P6I7E3_9PEZI|nr:uncharacterized protein CkaCkLH20_04729 [Colletotrichum karsti]KAF9877594.1 hypothetical protein CkaCkLH20_04729 [Colletotrichum karsti]
MSEQSTQLYKHFTNHENLFPSNIAARNSYKMSGKMNQDDKSRIMSGQARGGKDMSSGGFAARAQSAADKNLNAGVGGQQGGQGGKGQGGQQGQKK